MKGAKVGRRLVALSLLAAAAACGGGDGDAAAAGDTAVLVSPAPGPETPVAAAQETEPTDERTVSATLTEWSVQLSRDTVPAGEVAFRVANAGTMHHALEVEGQGIEEETDHIQPGRYATLTVNLQPGTYEVYCPVADETGNHRERGMTTQLVVQ